MSDVFKRPSRTKDITPPEQEPEEKKERRRKSERGRRSSGARTLLTGEVGDVLSTPALLGGPR